MVAASRGLSSRLLQRAAEAEQKLDLVRRTLDRYAGEERSSETLIADLRRIINR